MDGRMVAGLSVVIIFTFMLSGIFGALMPTELSVIVKNSSGALQYFTISITCEGKPVKNWTLDLDPSKTIKVGYPLDIGKFNLNITVEGASYIAISFEVGFKVLDKKRTEMFSILNDTVIHGKLY